MKKILLAVLCCAGSSVAAWAAAPDTVEMERIVVTASRTAQEIKNSPQSTTVIDQTQIEDSNAQNVIDILRSQAGVHVRDYTGTGKTVNVDMRGFGETGPSNMLVLIDGRRVNSIDLSTTDWSQIPLSQVERIEITRGASAVLYGDNATAGVINIFTRKGTKEPRFVLETRGGSFDTYAVTAEASGSVAGQALRVSAEHFDTEGYRKNSFLNRSDFGLQWERSFSPELEAGLTWGYHKDRYGLPGPLSEEDMLSLGRRASVYPDDKAFTEDYFADLSISQDLKDKGKLSASFSGRVRSVDAYYYNWLWKNSNEIVTLGCLPKYQLEGQLAGRPHTFITGADIYYYKDLISDGMFDSPGDKIRITRNSLGFYLQDQIDLTSRWSLRTGFRHLREDYRFKQTEQVQEKEEVDLSDNVYEAGAIFTPSPQSSLYLNFSTSLRYPLVDEFFSSNTYGTGGLNTSLQPQTSKNLEIGGRYAFAPRTFLNINSFFIWTDNEIYFDPLTFVNSNYDKTERWGCELESQVPLTPTVSFFTNYTFTKALFGEGTYEGQDIPAVPRYQTSGGLRWTPRDNLSLAFHIDYVGSMYLINDEANGYKPLDAFVTGGIDANFSLKGTELFVRLDNLLDAEYSEYGVVSTFAGTRNFYPAAGRRVLAGLRHLF